MKSNFGIRFMLRSAMSFCMALLILFYAVKFYSSTKNFAESLVEFSVTFTTFLIILGYYRGFNTILRTRVSPEIYLIYVSLGVILGVGTIYNGLLLLSKINDVGYLPYDIFAWTILGPLMIAFLPPFIFYKKQVFKENPTYRQWFLEGHGGSSSWASVGTFTGLTGKLKQSVWGHWFSKIGLTAKGIFIGRTLFADDPFQRYAVIDSDEHMMTVGLSGSGKTTSVQNHTYSTYVGSIIGFDPKGELARATANRRGPKNIGGKGNTKKHFPHGEVAILDPFGVLEDQNFKSTYYSILSDIDSNDPEARQSIVAISEGGFTPEDLANKHFEENPKNIFQGYLTHVLTQYPKENHTLPFVYDLMCGVNPETGYLDFDYQQKVILEMSKNSALGGLAREAARILLEMGPNERGSMITTMSRNMKWIGDPHMRRHLSKSNFSFRDFGIKKAVVGGKEKEIIQTVYIVLPDQLIDEFARWIRILMIFAIRMLQGRGQEKKPNIPTLVIIDEFARLGGKIDIISKGFGILRSYGIKLWTFNQTIGQLKHDYPKTWSTMIGNSTLQAFGTGMGDNETADFISKTLGSRIIKKKEWTKGFLGFPYKKIVSETPRELLTPSEVTTKLGKSANVQIIFPNDGFPMRLERLAFKKLKFGKRKFRTMGLGGLKDHIED